MTYKTQTNSRSSSTSSIAAAPINDETDEQRRKFLGMVGGAALLSTTSLPALAGDEEREQLAAPAGEGPASGDEAFRERAFKLRGAAAQANAAANINPAGSSRKRRA